MGPLVAVVGSLIFGFDLNFVSLSEAALKFIRTQTPPGLVLQVDPSLSGSDLGIGLLTERRNYYY